MPQQPYVLRTILREEFPVTLQNMHRPPASLYIAGELPPPYYKYLCVIGSRTYSSYGKDSCQNIISGLAGHPICIVSGMAIGIDSIAHEAALSAGLRTIAFPGSGLNFDALYPVNKRNLALDILNRNGALVSEFEPNQPGGLWTFPNRNRLMAGISHAILVIEARRGSGTLITAQYATDFDRDIMAVPGPISAELSYGPHMLIRRGAALITSAEDILHEFNLVEQPQIPLVEKRGSRSRTPRTYSKNIESLHLSPEERRLCSFLAIESLTSTDLMEKSGLSITQLNTLMTQLELSGVVYQEQGVYGLK